MNNGRSGLVVLMFLLCGNMSMGDSVLHSD